jgi:hypothetical protein
VDVDKLRCGCNTSSVAVIRCRFERCFSPESQRRLCPAMVIAVSGRAKGQGPARHEFRVPSRWPKYLAASCRLVSPAHRWETRPKEHKERRRANSRKKTNKRNSSKNLFLPFPGAATISCVRRVPLVAASPAPLPVLLFWCRTAPLSRWPPLLWPGDEPLARSGWLAAVRVSFAAATAAALPVLPVSPLPVPGCSVPLRLLAVCAGRRRPTWRVRRVSRPCAGFAAHRAAKGGECGYPAPQGPCVLLLGPCPAPKYPNTSARSTESLGNTRAGHLVELPDHSTDLGIRRCLRKGDRIFAGMAAGI